MPGINWTTSTPPELASIRALEYLTPLQSFAYNGRIGWTGG